MQGTSRGGNKSRLIGFWLSGQCFYFVLLVLIGWCGDFMARYSIMCFFVVNWLLFCTCIYEHKFVVK